MAYADYMFYFEDERPRRKRPYSQKSLRKFARRRACQEAFWRDLLDDRDITDYSYTTRVLWQKELSKLREIVVGANRNGLERFANSYRHLKEKYPPCPLPD